jgi:uncharacterized protein (TIGR00255 family)
MLSMTGYGRGSAPLANQANQANRAAHADRAYAEHTANSEFLESTNSQIVVDIRSVNHRFLEVRLHMAPELASHAASVEQVLRARIARGRVDVSVRVDGPPEGRVQLDQQRARASFEALKRLRDELAPSEPVPLGLLSSVPGLFRDTTGPSDPERARACQRAAEAACNALHAMRREEGARLASDLRMRCEQITRDLNKLRDDLPALVRKQQDKLKARVAQLVESSGLVLDHGRIEHEIAILADRADISEELTRLHSHASALLPLLELDTAEPLGHRVDFLLQEMSREANTAAAKLPDAASTQVMLAIKSELLRMREQAQNVS